MVVLKVLDFGVSCLVGGNVTHVLVSAHHLGRYFSCFNSFLSAAALEWSLLFATTLRFLVVYSLSSFDCANSTSLLLVVMLYCFPGFGVASSPCGSLDLFGF